MNHPKRHFLRVAFIRFIPIGVAGTLIAFLVYGAAQFLIRSGANDPQIEIAYSVKIALESGLSPNLFDREVTKRIDLEKSLEPFVIIYNKQGIPISSGAALEGVVRVPPNGVFDAAEKQGNYRVTWQPNDTVRIATVVVPYKDGYVLAGRSLREPENRVATLSFNVFLAWLVILIATFIASCFATFAERKNYSN